MFSFKKFWLYCWGIIFKPIPTLKQLAAEASLSYEAQCYVSCYEPQSSSRDVLSHWAGLYLGESWPSLIAHL